MKAPVTILYLKKILIIIFLLFVEYISIISVYGLSQREHILARLKKIEKECLYKKTLIKIKTKKQMDYKKYNNNIAISNYQS